MLLHTPVLFLEILGPHSWFSRLPSKHNPCAMRVVLKKLPASPHHVTSSADLFHNSSGYCTEFVLQTQASPFPSVHFISVAHMSVSGHRPWLGAPRSILSGLPVLKCSEAPAGSFSFFSLRRFWCSSFFLHIGTFCNVPITLDLPMYPLDTSSIHWTCLTSVLCKPEG